jgi:hypothetical protein
MDGAGPLQDKLSRAAMSVTKARRFIKPDELSDANPGPRRESAQAAHRYDLQ